MTHPTAGRATAVAHSNIALAKYWGKADTVANLPAVPSLSMTLAALRTRTTVRFDASLHADQLQLDGAAQEGRELSRVSKLLDGVRTESGAQLYAQVISHNDFPTASGLASSASGFAALALAARAAAGLDCSLPRVSAMARAASASAARSAFGGYVVLESAGHAALPLAPGEHFPLVMLVTVLTQQPKAISSTQAMQLTAQTSPYYSSWVAHAPAVFSNVKRALLDRDFPALGEAVEHSALAMHATMMAARPGIVYLQPQTLQVMSRVRELRAQGVPGYFTMDAGPHVKVLTLPEHSQRLEHELKQLPDVVRVIPSGPGPDAHLVADDAPLPTSGLPTSGLPTSGLLTSGAP
jgi:diphosphomevalonate decarboxylase